MSESAFVLFVLGAIVVCADWLERRPAGRLIGGAIIALLLGMLLANLGLIPTVNEGPPLYRYLIGIGAPVSIFLLLLDARLAALKRAGLPMLLAFGIGATGTLIGVAVAFWVTGTPGWLGEQAAAVGGMYAATYIGGSANLTAVALHFGVLEQPPLMAAVNVVDSVVGSLWIAALVILARVLQRLDGSRPAPTAAIGEETPDARRVSVVDLAALLALAFGAFWLSQQLAAWASQRGLAVPAILILTTLALGLAQVPAVHRLGGARMLGVYTAYLFLAVIGAGCDFEALGELGNAGGLLLLFVLVTLLGHSLILFGAGRLLRLGPETLAIASSANVGGALTILPVARGLGRMDLLLPGIVVGLLGNALGTYLGFLMAWFLQAVPYPISAAHAVPPPLEQVVADCAHPTYASDMLVCGDAELLGLDRQVADALKRIRPATVATPASLLEAQDAWFRRRSRCAFSAQHKDCLKAAYSERIAVLDVLGKASPALAQAGTRARCSGAPWGPIDVRVVAAGGPLIVLDDTGRVLAVALGAQPREDWAAFVRFVADGETIRLIPLERPAFECRGRPDPSTTTPRSVPATTAGS
jgi:uncharacterized membrane protein/uncharacterized protein YecT (DUF1311 family)